MPLSKETPAEKEKQPEKLESSKEILKKSIENFFSRSDEPGKFLSEQEKLDLIEKTKSDPKALEEWKKEKRGSKYRINSLSIPLSAGLIFLDSNEALSLSAEKRQELLERIQQTMKHVKEGYGKPYTASDVQEVIDIANELKKYL